jgi:hypothetical protein
MADQRTDNNTYVYPLIVPQKGQFVMAKSDPNNTPINKAKLEALYGKGNVVVVDDKDYLQYVGSDINLLSLLASEKFDPLSVANNTTPSSSVTPDMLPAGSVALPPPRNLKLGTPKTVAGTGGTNTVSIQVFFDSVSGANIKYEAKALPSQEPPSTSVVSNVVNTSSSHTLAFAWDVIANATNYVMVATNQSTKKTNSLFVIPNSGDTRLSGTIAGVASGNYVITITPYNSNGIAGVAYTSGIVTV